MQGIFGRGLLVCALALPFASGCSAASRAMADYGGAAPPAPVMAEPSPAPPPAEMAADFRSIEREEKDEGRVASAGGPVPGGQPATAPSGNNPQTPPQQQTKPSSEVAVIRAPLLIYTAQITMAVFEVNSALAQIEELGRELGGFLARRDDMSITIRVPVAAFDTAIRRIEKSGDMIHRNVTAQDVTEEFRDLEIRIRNARAVRDRLEQLLAKAAKVEESVVVERELERVTGEIERMEGRIKFLRDRAAFSTITVTYQPKAKEEISQSPFRLPVPWLDQLGLSRLLRL